MSILMDLKASVESKSIEEEVIDKIIGQQRMASITEMMKEEDMEDALTNEEILHLFSAVKGDKNRFKQILLNFLSNGLKFTQTGKNIHIEVTILEVAPLDSRRQSIQSYSPISPFK